MSPSAPPHVDPAIAQGANQALSIARGSFLQGLAFNALMTTEFPTGVSFDRDAGISLLFINLKNPLASSLLSSTGSWKEAWLLILGHESGHLRLNSICQDRGEDPDDPDAQLRAIGIDQNAYGLSHIADFQKETAIESFCDACAGLAARAFLGGQWRRGVEALRDHRSRVSKSLGLWEGDEYATSPALEELLKRNGEIEPAEAAHVAFEASLRQTSELKKSAVAIATGIPELKQRLGDRLKQWRKAFRKDTPSPPPTPPSAL